MTQAGTSPQKFLNTNGCSTSSLKFQRGQCFIKVGAYAIPKFPKKEYSDSSPKEVLHPPKKIQHMIPKTRSGVPTSKFQEGWCFSFQQKKTHFINLQLWFHWGVNFLNKPGFKTYVFHQHTRSQPRQFGSIFFIPQFLFSRKKTATNSRYR